MFSTYNIYVALHKRIVNNRKFNSIKIDLFDINQISHQINKLKIDIVINLAGISNVDQCETDPDLAYEVNQNLARKIAKVCNKEKIKLIHISTDHFYGDSNKLHSETDKLVLLNHYAKSKYAGECDVLEANPSTLVCRTNFFGFGPEYRKSFSDWIISSFKKQKPLYLFDDVFFSPLLGNLVPKYAHDLLDLNAAGIFNLSANDAITKKSFAEYICSYFNFPKNLVRKSSLKERSDLTRRPLSMGLSNCKASKILGCSLGNVSENIVLLLGKKVI